MDVMFAVWGVSKSRDFELCDVERDDFECQEWLVSQLNVMRCRYRHLFVIC
ncbi:MAG: hypothetical protein ACI9R3_006055 [Verrucomicrobiales bacterium]|jgi:hypothetical protein